MIVIIVLMHGIRHDGVYCYRKIISSGLVFYITKWLIFSQ